MSQTCINSITWLTMDDFIKQRFQEQWFQFIKDNPHKPWDWFGLSRNPSISWKIVQDTLVSGDTPPWNWAALCENKMSYPYTTQIKKVKEIMYWKLFKYTTNRRKMNMYSRYLLTHHLLYKFDY